MQAGKYDWLTYFKPESPILYIPINDLNKPLFDNILDEKELFWVNNFPEKLKEGSLVFFIYKRQPIRCYIIEWLNKYNIFLTKCMFEILWKDWNYFANSKRHKIIIEPEIVEDVTVKRRIQSFIESHLNR